MRLRELQRQFQCEILGKESSISSAIVDAPPLPAAARLAVYRNGYRMRLTEALDEVYPVLHRVLGDETFAHLAEHFIDAHPSVHRSIRWYGAELADFLIERAPFSEQPILAELARLEWTLSEVFDARDAPAVSRSALQEVEPAAWAALRFTFHPSARRLELEWNTVAVWQAASREEDLPAPERSPAAVAWLLWRQDLVNYFRSTDAVERTALEAALHGASFAEICATLTALLPEEEIPLRAATLIGTWADSGIISSVG